MRKERRKISFPFSPWNRSILFHAILDSTFSNQGGEFCEQVEASAAKQSVSFLLHQTFSSDYFLSYFFKGSNTKKHFAVVGL